MEMSEPQKRLYMYVVLLIASVFFAIGNPQGLWLPVGLGIGLVVVYAPDFLRRMKSGKNGPGDGGPVNDQNEQNK